MKPMKILHVVEAWKGGIATYVQALTNAQINDGHSVTILCDQQAFQSDIRKINSRISIYTASRKFTQIFKTAKEISNHIALENYDIIHCHSTFPGIYCRLIKKFKNLIYTPHGWSFFKKDKFIFARLAYMLVEKILSNRCEAIVCMSLEELNFAKKIKIKKEKLNLIYTGIPNIHALPTSSAETQKLKIGFLGRLDYQKGFDVLVEASNLLSDKIEIHVFGDHVRSSTSHQNTRMHMHGWIDSLQIHEKITSMNILIIPSRWEGFALTPLEAMRAGRAVIVSNLTSLHETVIHGYNGLVLKSLSAEEIARTLSELSYDFCKKAGENARHVFEQTFTFEIFYQKTMNLYSKTVSIKE